MGRLLQNHGFVPDEGRRWMIVNGETGPRYNRAIVYPEKAKLIPLFFRDPPNGIESQRIIGEFDDARFCARDERP